MDEPEEIPAQFLEARAGDVGVEVDALEQGIDLDGSLQWSSNRALCFSGDTGKYSTAT